MSASAPVQPDPRDPRDASTRVPPGLGRRAPVGVITLVAVNVVAFLYEVHLASGPLTDPGAMRDFVARFGLVPREFLREVVSPGTTTQSVWLTPFTAMFLHGGVAHLLGNLLYLAVFGRSLEATLGAVRFVAFYLLCGLAASAVLIASDPSGFVATVGASGAISGLLGAYVALHPGELMRAVSPGVRIPAIVLLAVWVVIGVLSSWDPDTAREGGIASWAHAGGFAAGFALATSLRLGGPLRSRSRS